MRRIFGFPRGDGGASADSLASAPMSRALSLTAVALALALATAAPALASGGGAVADCGADGTLNGHYSPQELQNALHNLPADLDEYSDCRDVIRGALLAAASGGKHPSSNKSNAVAGKNGKGHHRTHRSDRKTLERAAEQAGKPVNVAGAAVTPGIGNGAANELPGPVIAGFAGLALVALGGGGLLAWRDPRIRRLFRRS